MRVLRTAVGAIALVAVLGALGLVTCRVLKERGGPAGTAFAKLAASPAAQILPDDALAVVVLHEPGRNFRALGDDPALARLLEPAWWRAVRGEQPVSPEQAAKEVERSRRWRSWAAALQGQAAVALVPGRDGEAMVQLALAADRPAGWSLIAMSPGGSLRKEASRSGWQVASLPANLAPASDRFWIAAGEKRIVGASSLALLDELLGRASARPGEGAGGWRSDGAWLEAQRAVSSGGAIAAAWLAEALEAEKEKLPQAFSGLPQVAGRQRAAVLRHVSGWTLATVAAARAQQAAGPYLYPPRLAEEALLAVYLRDGRELSPPPDADTGDAAAAPAATGTSAARGGLLQEAFASGPLAGLRAVFSGPAFIALLELPAADASVPLPKIGVLVPVGPGAVDPARFEKSVASLAVGGSLGRFLGDLGRSQGDYRGMTLVSRPSLGFTITSAQSRDRGLVALDEATARRLVDAVVDETAASPAADAGGVVTRQVRLDPGRLSRQIAAILASRPPSALLLAGAGPVLRRAHAALEPFAGAREITLRSDAADGYEHSLLTLRTE